MAGSSYNRTVGKEERGTPGLVHKDLDFVDMHRTVSLPHHLAESLRDQIMQDANFLAGHGIIDLEWMLGVRVDAHPGPSLPKHPQGDRLHFCLPGVPDYALDAMLFAIFGQRSNT